MLSGWVCLYLFLVYVLTHGGKIQGWHAVVWIMATFVGILLVAGGKREVEGGRRTEDGGQSAEDGRRNAEDSNLPPSVIRPPVSGLWHLASGLWYQSLIALALTIVGPALPIFFSWILSHFTDFSWDGMTTRGVTVRNLMKGDPALNAYPFGHVLAGFLASLS